MAEMMMTLRQRGTPMGTLLAATQRVEDSGPGGGGIMALSRDIIVEAYDEPHWSTPETKQRSIGDFRDKVHVECLKGVKAATHY
jgi:hypothetical protein